MLNLSRAERRFWLRWTWATMGCIALATLIGPFGFLGGFVPLATLQWLALRGYWPQARYWFWATLVGGGLGTVAMVFGLLLTGSAVGGAAIAAAVQGMAQALALRGSSRHWRWWPLINMAILVPTTTWAVSQGIQASFSGSAINPWWFWPTLGVGTGLVGGAIKGLALILMLRAPAPRTRK